MPDMLDDKELPLPPADSGEEAAVLLLTEEEMLEARVEVDSLTDYVKRMFDLVDAVVPQNAGRILVQVNFDAVGEAVVYVRAPKTISRELLSQLEALLPPATKGPVSFVLMKQR